MAYLHCHNCGWSQDDFWDFQIRWKRIFKWNSRPFGYNPLSIFLEDVSMYWKPRYIKMDSYWCKEQGLSSNKVHSWWMLKYEMKRNIRRIHKMKYLTYESFKKAKKNGSVICPKCGCKNEFDID